jgi:hypothetical protein
MKKRTIMRTMQTLQPAAKKSTIQRQSTLSRQHFDMLNNKPSQNQLILFF